MNILQKCIVVLAAAVFLPPSLTAQNITLKKTSVPVKEVLGDIENMSEYRFFYNAGLVDAERKVTINVTGATIREILDKLFQGTEVTFKIEDNDIILTDQIKRGGGKS